MAIRFTVDAQGVHNLEEVVSVMVGKVADEIAEDAASNAPVDTGRLRGSIETSVSGTTATVEATAPYSAYVEEGTSKAAAQPFLKPALYTKRKV